MTIGTTAAGYPYPNGDDPIRNGDNVFKTFAEAVGAHQAATVSAGALTSPVSVGAARVNTTATLLISAVSWSRLLLITYRFTATAQSGLLEGFIRDTVGNNIGPQARVPAANQTGLVILPFALEAGRAASFTGAANMTSGAGTVTNDPRYTGLDMTMFAAAVGA